MPKIMLNGIEYAGSGGDGNTISMELTQAEYDALPSTKLTDDIMYMITDGNNPNVVTASQVMYDNSDSGLIADKVQGAIDEVANVVKSQSEVFTLTFPATITDLYIRYQNCYYCPITDEVHIAFAIYSASGKIPVGGNVFATIPEKYRPTVARNTGYAVVIPSSSGQYAPHIEAISAVGTNGELSLGNWIWGSTTTQILVVDFSYIR